jgi:hypothetical protein
VIVAGELVERVRRADSVHGCVSIAKIIRENNNEDSVNPHPIGLWFTDSECC